MVSGIPRLLRFSVITPEGCALDSEAVDLVFPAHDGQRGVLAHHAPMICKLGMGLVRFNDAMRYRHALYIEGGFGIVQDNHISLLTGQAVLAEDMPLAEAEMLMLEAQALPAGSPGEIQSRQSALKKARYLLDLAKTYKS